MQHIEKSQEIYWNSLKQPLIEIAECSLAYTPVLSPWMNSVIASKLTEKSIPSSVETVFDFFKAKEVPFSWWVSEKQQSFQLENELLKKGAENHGIFDAMELFLDLLKPIVEPPLEVEVVSSSKSLKSFVDVLIQSYEAPSFLAQSVESLLQNGEMIHLIGKTNGNPVSVASLAIDNDLVGIYHVGTIPDERKKGFASSLMRYALKLAKSKGCKSSVLTSTPMANNLYRKLGYETKNLFQVFMIC